MIVRAPVKNADFATIINDVHSEIVRLRWHFLRKHLGRQVLVGPATYEHDVKAFCVLAHSALEQCFEEISLATALYHTEAFERGGAATRTMMSLLLYHGSVERTSTDTTALTIRTFDTLRAALAKAKEAYSRVVADNNGVFFPYLAALLQPIGLDLQLDEDDISAIKQLRSARGDHAHAYVARQILSPEDAGKHVYRCLGVARRAAEKGAYACGISGLALRRLRIPA